MLKNPINPDRPQDYRTISGENVATITPCNKTYTVTFADKNGYYGYSPLGGYNYVSYFHSENLIELNIIDLEPLQNQISFELSQTTRAAIKTAIVNQAIIEFDAKRIDKVALDKIQGSEV